jgi:hypothetical protein
MIMDKTGIGLLEVLALVAILLPLVPILILFASKAYKQDSLALLMVFSLVSFIQNLILYVPKFVSVDILFIRATFQLAQFIILLILLEMELTAKWLKEGIKILLISFVSVIITVYSLQGIQDYIRVIELIQALVLIVFTVFTLLQLIKSYDIQIFHCPVFWIATGILFYYCMFFITQSIPEYTTALQEAPQQKKALLLIIMIIQFVFYTIAATVAGSKNKDDHTIIY